jgi:hypothetical protein
MAKVPYTHMETPQQVPVPQPASEPALATIPIISTPNPTPEPLKKSLFIRIIAVLALVQVGFSLLALYRNTLMAFGGPSFLLLIEGIAAVFVLVTKSKKSYKVARNVLLVIFFFEVLSAALLLGLLIFSFSGSW